MVLSGWTQAPAVVENSGSTSNVPQAEVVEAEKDTKVEEISEPSGKKRKLTEVDIPNAVDGTGNHKEVKELDDDDDDDDLVMLEYLDSVANKKKRLH